MELNRIAAASGKLAGLTDLVSQRGQLLCQIAEQLSPADLETQMPTLILSKDQVLVDQPVPLSLHIAGLGQIHLPLHAEQLRSLQHPASP